MTEPIPAGIKPIYIRAVVAEKLGFVTAEDAEEKVTFLTFKKSEMVADLDANGKFSPWYQDSDDKKSSSEYLIRNCPHEDILVVADIDGKYGESFYLCFNPEISAQIVAEAEKVDEVPSTKTETYNIEEDVKESEEDREMRLAEEALQSEFVHDSPLTVGAYKPYDDGLTEADVNSLNPIRVRPPVVIRLQKQRKTLRGPYQFHDRMYDPLHLSADFRPRRNPDCETVRLVTDIGIQTGGTINKTQREFSTQTNVGVSVSFGVQCDTERDLPVAPRSDSALLKDDLISMTQNDTEKYGDAAKLILGEIPSGSMTTLQIRNAVSAFQTLENQLLRGQRGGAATFSLTRNRDRDGGGKFEEKLLEFLESVRSDIEVFLDQNVALNPFLPPGVGMGGLDAMIPPEYRQRAEFVEIAQYFELLHSQGCIITSITWHPSSNQREALFAAGLYSGKPMESKLKYSALPSPNKVLIFSLTKMSSVLILDAPADVTCVSWNPTNPALIAVGCLGGQVAVFNISEFYSNGQISVSSSSTSAGKKLAGRSAATLKPTLVSHIEHSHSRSVVAIRWLPVAAVFSQKGLFTDSDGDEWSRQLISVAADASVFVWDITYFKKAARGSYEDDSATSNSADSLNSGYKLSVSSSSASAAAALAKRAGKEMDTGVPATLDRLWLPLHKLSQGPPSLSVIRVTSVSFPSWITTSTLAHVCDPASASSALVSGNGAQKRPRPVYLNLGEPLLMSTESGSLLVFDWAPPGEDLSRAQWLAMRNPVSSSTVVLPPSQQQLGNSSCAVFVAPLIVPAAAAGSASQTHPSSQASKSKSASKGLEDDGSGRAARFVYTSDGGPAVVQTEYSPLVPGLFAVLYASHVELFLAGIQVPLFVSPPLASGSYTCMTFSPLCPSVLLLCNSSGILSAVSFTDASLSPITSIRASTSAITSISCKVLTVLSGQSQLLSHSLGNAAVSSSSSGAPEAAQTEDLLVGGREAQSTPTIQNSVYVCVGDSAGAARLLLAPPAVVVPDPNEVQKVNDCIARALHTIKHSLRLVSSSPALIMDQSSETLLNSPVLATTQQGLGAAAVSTAALSAAEIEALNEEKKAAVREKYAQIRKSVLTDLGLSEEDLTKNESEDRVKNSQNPTSKGSDARGLANKMKESVRRDDIKDSN